MILAVTGTNGAGKGTVVDYLAGKGFAHYSVRSFLVTEIERRGLPVDRNSMRAVANELRSARGAEYLVKELYTAAVVHGGNAVIESVRALGEAAFLKAKGIPLLAINAERHLRFERVVARGSHTDHVDYETWVAQEEREWLGEVTHDMNVPAVMALADVEFVNNNTLEALHAQIDEALKNFKK